MCAPAGAIRRGRHEKKMESRHRRTEWTEDQCSCRKNMSTVERADTSCHRTFRRMAHNTTRLGLDFFKKWMVRLIYDSLKWSRCILTHCKQLTLIIPPNVRFPQRYCLSLFSYKPSVHIQWCGLRPSVLGQDRSETKKIGLSLGLANLVLWNILSRSSS